MAHLNGTEIEVALCDTEPAAPSGSSDERTQMFYDNKRNSVQTEVHSHDILRCVECKRWIFILPCLNVPSTDERPIISNLPIDHHILIVSALFAFAGLISGGAMVFLGVVISSLISYHADHVSPPYLWWCGIFPFLASILGIRLLARKNRKQIYWWGLSMTVLAVLQTGVMGYIGNLTPSHYDAWPPQKIESICQNFEDEENCFCQDKHFGIYSEYDVPGTKYIHEGSGINMIRWRESMFSSCEIVKKVSILYYTCITTWVVFCFSAVGACIAAHAGSVCSHQITHFHPLQAVLRTNMVLTQEELELRYLGCEFDHEELRSNIYCSHYGTNIRRCHNKRSIDYNKGINRLHPKSTNDAKNQEFFPIKSLQYDDDNMNNDILEWQLNNDHDSIHALSSQEDSSEDMEHRNTTITTVVEVERVTVA